MSLRLFIALELPDAVRAVLASMQASLKQLHPTQVKWVAPDSIHMTLQFLGAVSEDRLPEIEAAVERAATSSGPLTLRVHGAGGFPNAGRARVLWAGVAGDTAGLLHLVSQWGTQLTPIGFPPEARPFSPHLTLGRARDPRGIKGLETVLESLAVGPCEDWRVEQVCLYRSQLSPAGARYDVLSRATLKAGPTRA